MNYGLSRTEHFLCLPLLALSDASKLVYTSFFCIHSSIHIQALQKKLVIDKVSQYSSYKQSMFLCMSKFLQSRDLYLFTITNDMKAYGWYTGSILDHKL